MKQPCLPLRQRHHPTHFVNFLLGIKLLNHFGKKIDSFAFLVPISASWCLGKFSQSQKNSKEIAKKMDWSINSDLIHKNGISRQSELWKYLMRSTLSFSILDQWTAWYRMRVSLTSPSSDSCSVDNTFWRWIRSTRSTFNASTVRKQLLSQTA